MLLSNIFLGFVLRGNNNLSFDLTNNIGLKNKNLIKRWKKKWNASACQRVKSSGIIKKSQYGFCSIPFLLTSLVYFLMKASIKCRTTVDNIKYIFTFKKGHKISHGRSVNKKLHTCDIKGKILNWIIFWSKVVNNV